MPTPDSVGVTPGSGVNVATYDITESAITKSLQRIVLNDSAGVERGTSTAPLVTQQGDGTNSANIFTGNSGNNGLITGGAELNVAFSITTTQVLGPWDVGNYSYMSIAMNTVMGGSPSLVIQGNNDNGSVWYSFVLGSPTNNNSSGVTASITTSVISLAGPIPYRYVRISFTQGSSGTEAGNILFTSAPRVAFNAPVGNFAAAASVVDGAAVSQATAPILAYQYGFNGATMDRIRAANKFFTATATANGDTSIWTPSSGKKFRILAYNIQVTDDVAISGGGPLDVTLNDNGSSNPIGMGLSLFAPATAQSTNPGVHSTGWITLGNGQVSALANNVLRVNLSAALTNGKVRVNVIGTEE